MSSLAEFYDARRTWRSKPEERGRFKAAVQLARLGGKCKVLDVGARDGGLSWYLPATTRYDGMDIAPAAPGIQQADVSKGIGVDDGSYDAVFALDVLEHVPNPHAVLSEMTRVLRLGGVAVVSVPNPYHFKEVAWNLFGVADRQGHVSSWTPQTMRAAGEMVGLTLCRSAGTYLVPGLPSPRLLCRSIVYCFEKSADKPPLYKQVIDGLRAGAF